MTDREGTVRSDDSPSETSTAVTSGSQRVKRGRRLRVALVVAAAAVVGAAVWFVGPSLMPEQCFLNGQDVPCDVLEGLMEAQEMPESPPSDATRGAPGDDSDFTESGFPAAELDRIRARYDEIAQSVVKVGTETGHGTGWFVDDRHVITNWHNVINFSPDAVPMELRDGRKLYGSVVATDEFDDIAIVVLDEPTQLPALSIATELPGTGDPVYFVGHPGALGDWIVGIGVVTREDFGPPEFVTSTLPASPGASGSAMMNLAGEVVALISGCIEPKREDEGSEATGPQIFASVPRGPEACGGTDIIRVMQFVNQRLRTD